MPPSSSRMLPQRPFIDHIAPNSTPPRRKLPEIPRSAKLAPRPAIYPEPHYPSSFHSSFDEGGAEVQIQHSSNPHLSTCVPAPTIYESYHQQIRHNTLQRQQTSPMGTRQLPMAPFGHRRTASSGSFVVPTSPEQGNEFRACWCRNTQSISMKMGWFLSKYNHKKAKVPPKVTMEFCTMRRKCSINMGRCENSY